MKKFILILIALCIFTASVFADAHSAEVATDETVAEVSVSTANGASGIKYLAAGLAVGLACIAGGMAVARIGAAAMGAMAENAELSGKALPFVGLAEGICLWGFLVALFIILN